MSDTRHQVEYAQRKRCLQQAATSLLVQAEQILSDLDHDRAPGTDGTAVVRDAAAVAVQLAVLAKLDEIAARMRAEKAA